MKLYEIVNPSDPYTVVGERAVVAAAILLLGNGNYGLDATGEPDGSTEGMPIFLAGHGALAWFSEEFGVELPVFLDARRTEIADALDSVLIGKPAARKTYELGLSLIEGEDKRRAWCDHWHEERRSSLNDIGAHAWAWAAHLRGQAGRTA